MKAVGFIGAGNMGFAIIKGIAESESSKDVSLYAYELDSEKAERLKAYGVTVCSSQEELVESCKYIFLAIKPQQFDSVFDKVGTSFTTDKVIISICAGITAEYIESRTVQGAKVVLVMPNTPFLLGEGASALSRNANVTDDEFGFVKNIFDLGGKASVVPVDKMKEVIAINGSSPAFIYLFAKAFVDYAKSVDIDENTAKELFSQSLIGSAKMITDSGYTIDELIKMVSSPGGTTLAGLQELYDGKLVETTTKACESCTRRAYELSK